MPLPPGVVTRAVSFGPATDPWGATLTDGTVTFIPTTNLIYSGTPILIVPEAVPLNGSGVATATLICTDQSGFTDGDGQPIVDWPWRVRVKVRGGPSFTRLVLIPTGGSTLDLDTLVPVTTGPTIIADNVVRTVNGTGPDPTGNVTVSGGSGVGIPTGGTTGQVLTKTSGTDFAVSWTAATTGPAGKSAYQSAVDGGYSGTEAQWVASLKGAKGDTGVGAPGQDSTVPGPAGPAMATVFAVAGVFPARPSAANVVYAIADTAVAPTDAVTGDLLVVWDSTSAL